MINRSLYETAVSNKMKLLAFESFITDTFMNALPYGTSDLTANSVNELREYVKSAIESAGGYSLVVNALNSEKNPMKHALLADINNICTTSAEEAVHRIMLESKKDLENKNSSMEELVASADFSNEELAKFKSNAKEIDIDHLSEIIKDKVLQVLKSEQKAHNRVEDINADLRQLVADNEKEDDLEDPEEEKEEEETNKKDDDATESFVHLLIGSTNNNEHKSFFSTIQKAACEQILVTENIGTLDPNEISARRLKNVTFENTLKIFNTKKANELDDALENLMAIQAARSQEDSMEHMSVIAESAMVDSITIYTMLESLHTLNLIAPTQAEMRTAVESSTSMDIQKAKNKKTVLECVNRAIRHAHTIARTASSSTIESAIEGFNRVKECVDCAKEQCIPTETLIAVEECLDLLRKRQETLNVAIEGTVENFMESKRTASNVSQMIRVKGMVKRTPSAKSIVFTMHPNDSHLDVTVESAVSPYKSAHSFVTLEGINGNADAFRKIVEGSVLMESGIPEIYLAIKDGTGRKLKIKSKK